MANFANLKNFQFLTSFSFSYFEIVPFRRRNFNFYDFLHGHSSHAGQSIAAEIRPPPIFLGVLLEQKSYFGGHPKIVVSHTNLIIEIKGKIFK
jgi:hypothetical protein